MFVWGLFVYRVSWPLGMRQDLMEMQAGERCLKVCKTGGGVFWEEQQSFGCRGWKESKSLKALREHRAPILSDPWASVGKHLQRVCSARSEEIMTEWGCMSARVGVEMHCPQRHWSTIPWGCAPGPLWPHNREHRDPCREFIIHTYMHNTHYHTAATSGDERFDLFTVHTSWCSYDANLDTTYSVTLLYFTIYTDVCRTELP